MTPQTQLIDAVVERLEALRPFTELATYNVIALHDLMRDLADGDIPRRVKARDKVLALVWPGGNIDPAWWSTPLGRFCAAAGNHDDTDPLTYAETASMLGVTRGTVSQLVHRGTLLRHSDGGVVRSSVMRRITY
jgi:excisionase family DNA binding protein